MSDISIAAEKYVERPRVGIKGPPWLLGRVLGYLALCAYVIFSLFPVFWMLLMSLKTGTDLIGYPPKFFFMPTLENYVGVVSPETAGLLGYQGVPTVRFVEHFRNSVVIAAGTIAVALVLGVPVAYALARMRFRGREAFAFTFLGFRFIPEMVLLIPLYMLFRQLGLYNTFPGLILAYQIVALPLVIWLMRGYFEDIPIEVEQAARVDGYPWWAVFWKVALPLARPGLGVSALLAFMFTWNNFSYGLLLAADYKTQPVTVGILGYLMYQGFLWGHLAASVIIIIIPQIILLLFVQRYLVRGLTFGAVRG